VGQAIGRGRPGQGAYSTTSTLHLIMTYMMLVAAAFIFTPEPLLHLFKAHHHTSSQYEQIKDLGVILMRFVAVFCFFDALNLVFSGAIKGAGDTRFIMWAIGALSIGVMIVPIYVAVDLLGAGLYAAWTIATLYICALGLAFMWRYRQGKWKSMKVIDPQPVGNGGRGRCTAVLEAGSGSP